MSAAFPAGAPAGALPLYRHAVPSLAKHRPALPAESPAGSRRSPGEAPGDPDSRRVAEARSRAERRLARQRGAFRPLGGAVVIAVIAPDRRGSPGVGLHGKALGATAALCLCGPRARPQHHPALQPPLAGGAERDRGRDGSGRGRIARAPAEGGERARGASAVWIAVARLPLRFGVAIGAGTNVALDLAAVGAGESSVGVIATTLLCALLGLMAYFNRQARESQDRTEVLLAELEDARAEQTRAAALRRAREDRQRAARRARPRPLGGGDPARGRPPAGRARSGRGGGARAIERAGRS